MFAAFAYIPEIDHPVVRWSMWALYGYTEGLLFTGLWVCSAAFDYALGEHGSNLFLDVRP